HVLNYPGAVWPHLLIAVSSHNGGQLAGNTYKNEVAGTGRDMRIARDEVALVELGCHRTVSNRKPERIFTKVFADRKAFSSVGYAVLLVTQHFNLIRAD